VRLRGDDIEWQEADGELLVLDRRHGRYLGVNRSGATLWLELSSTGGASEESLVDKLVDTHGLGRQRAQTDVSAFLRWLEDRDLLEG
jgi:Coenzyme PQQ synthesis protein D (PqqD)